MTVDLELLSDSERDVIEALRSRGFVVVVWTPAEVGDAPAGHCEDRITELGHEVIGDLQGEEW